MWSTSKEKKLDIEGETAGLKLAINNMEESHKREQTGGNGQSQYDKARDLNIITCLRCHKKNNFQDNCPLEKKQAQALEMKKIQRPDMNLLLPGD